MSTRGHLASCLVRTLACSAWREIYSARGRRNSLQTDLTQRRVARRAVYNVYRCIPTLVDEEKSHPQDPLARTRSIISRGTIVYSPSDYIRFSIFRFFRFSVFRFFHFGLARKPYALPEYIQVYGTRTSPPREAIVDGTARSRSFTVRSDSRCSTSVTVRLTNNNDRRRRQKRSHKSSYWRRCIRWIMSRQSLNTLLMFSVSTAHVKCG